MCGSHGGCLGLNPKDVTDSFEYKCPECTSNTDYMHSLEFDVIDVHSCNINFSNSCMYKFYSFLIVATFKLERLVITQ